MGNNSNNVTFADVQQTLTDLADNANESIDKSPHGAFWNVDEESFIEDRVDLDDPLDSQFYLYVKDGVMPPGGPRATDDQTNLIKTWLETEFS